MLPINKTISSILTRDAYEFFTGLGTIWVFSVKKLEFCRIVRVKSNTTFEIYMGHDNFLITDVHHDITGNHLLEIVSWSSNEVDPLAQKEVNCKLCRIILRASVWNVFEQNGLHNSIFGQCWLILSTGFWFHSSIVEKVHYWLGALITGTFNLLLKMLHNRVLFRESDAIFSRLQPIYMYSNVESFLVIDTTKFPMRIFFFCSLRNFQLWKVFPDDVMQEKTMTLSFFFQLFIKKLRFSGGSLILQAFTSGHPKNRMNYNF